MGPVDDLEDLRPSVRQVAAASKHAEVVEGGLWPSFT